MRQYSSAKPSPKGNETGEVPASSNSSSFEVSQQGLLRFATWHQHAEGLQQLMVVLVHLFCCKKYLRLDHLERNEAYFLTVLEAGKPQIKVLADSSV